MKDELRDYETDATSRKTAADWLMQVISGRKPIGFHLNGSERQEDAEPDGHAVAVAERPAEPVAAERARLGRFTREPEKPAAEFTAEDLCGAPVVPVIRVVAKASDAITADDVCWVPEELRLRPQPQPEPAPKPDKVDEAEFFPAPKLHVVERSAAPAVPENQPDKNQPSTDSELAAADISREAAPSVVAPISNGFVESPVADAEEKEITAEDIARDWVLQEMSPSAQEPRDGVVLPFSYRVLQSNGAAAGAGQDLAKAEEAANRNGLKEAGLHAAAENAKAAEGIAAGPVKANPFAPAVPVAASMAAPEAAAPEEAVGASGPGPELIAPEEVSAAAPVSGPIAAETATVEERASATADEFEAAAMVPPENEAVVLDVGSEPVAETPAMEQEMAAAGPAADSAVVEAQSPAAEQSSEIAVEAPVADASVAVEPVGEVEAAADPLEGQTPEIHAAEAAAAAAGPAESEASIVTEAAMGPGPSGKTGGKAGESVFAREGFWEEAARVDGSTRVEGAYEVPSVEELKRHFRLPEGLGDVDNRPEGWFSAWKTLLRLGSVLPWVAKAMPMLEAGGLPGLAEPGAGVAGQGGAVAGTGSQEMRQDVSGLRLVQYEIRTAVQDHSLQLKRMDEQLGRVRESLESKSAENEELTESLRSMTRLFRLAGMGLGALLALLIVLAAVLLMHGR